MKSVPALYACRFFVGLAESGFYPGIHYILGSWWGSLISWKLELNLYSGTLLVSWPNELPYFGQLEVLVKCSVVSYKLQVMLFNNVNNDWILATAYRNLNHRDGPCWMGGKSLVSIENSFHFCHRWLFIIDAIITLPIALLGYFVFPNLPWSKKKTLVSDRWRSLDRSRQNEGDWKSRIWALVSPKSQTSLFQLAYLYSSPALCSLEQCCDSATNRAIGWNLSMRPPAPVPGRHYTVSQINLCTFRITCKPILTLFQVPLPALAILSVNACLWAWLSGRSHAKVGRWPFIIASGILNVKLASIFRILLTFLRLLLRPFCDSFPFTATSRHISLSTIWYIFLRLLVQWFSVGLAKSAEVIMKLEPLLSLLATIWHMWFKQLHLTSSGRRQHFPRPKRGMTWSLILSIFLSEWISLWLSSRSQVTSSSMDWRCPITWSQWDQKKRARKYAEDNRPTRDDPTASPHSDAKNSSDLEDAVLSTA